MHISNIPNILRRSTHILWRPSVCPFSVMKTSELCLSFLNYTWLLLVTPLCSGALEQGLSLTVTKLPQSETSAPSFPPPSSASGNNCSILNFYESSFSSSVWVKAWHSVWKSTGGSWLFLITHDFCHIHVVPGGEIPALESEYSSAV